VNPSGNLFKIDVPQASGRHPGKKTKSSLYECVSAGKWEWGIIRELNNSFGIN